MMETTDEVATDSGGLGSGSDAITARREGAEDEFAGAAGWRERWHRKG